MSAFSPPPQGTSTAYTTAQRPSVGSYPTYADAQRAVDHLSDQKFPVDQVGIVGTDLRMVETVLGRLDWGRAALSGVAMGAWFGVLIGLLLGLFAESARGWLALMLWGLFYGVLFGVVWGLISYAFSGGRRDFVSTSQLVASRYDVVCTPEKAAEAQQVLARMGGGADSAAAPQ